MKAPEDFCRFVRLQGENAIVLFREREYLAVVKRMEYNRKLVAFIEELGITVPLRGYGRSGKKVPKQQEMFDDKGDSYLRQ